MRADGPKGLGAGERGATGLPAALAAALGLTLAFAASAWATNTPSEPTGYPRDLAVMTEARPAPSRGWISLALLTGSTQFDRELADYQWNTSPRLGWGLNALAGRGRWAAGLELWRAGTTQAIGDLGEPPQVHVTSLELVGEARLLERWGTGLWVRGHGGRLHIGYQPDQITIQPPGPVSPIAVGLDPVNTWTGGGGVALRHLLGDRWSVGLGFDMRRFAIDTAHRSGNQVVYAHETFGEWSARCEVARTLGTR